LLLRSGSVGRDALNRLHSLLISEPYELRIRRSAKLKVLSNCEVVLPITDISFPLKAVTILRKVCDELDLGWPVTFAVGYANQELQMDLPGTFSNRNIFWKAGFATGRFFGKLVGKE
jgi:hypothetical protein